MHGKENMYSKINAMALFGMEGVLIRVECDASSGLPEMSMVGFLGAEVREAKDRVRTALNGRNVKEITLEERKTLFDGMKEVSLTVQRDNGETEIAFPFDEPKL